VAVSFKSKAANHVDGIVAIVNAELDVEAMPLMGGVEAPVW